MTNKIEGKCHCENVRISIPQLTNFATRCTCGICSRYACVWGYFTESEVGVSIGQLGVEEYCYGDKQINFIRCKNCGCVTHYTSTKSGPEQRLAVNYLMFERTVLDKLVIRVFDGADTWQYLD
ncbi:hypothetical protein N9060_00785 [Arenicella sp.]|nr:hypothetical protein [Arenicella sp.]